MPASVAFVLAGLGAGGAERVVSLIAGIWSARGQRVTVIAFDRDGDAPFHHFPPSVRLVRLELPPGSAAGPVLVARRIAALRATLKSVAPDTVVSFLTKVNVTTLAASLGLPHRVVISERNNPRAQTTHRAWERMLYLLMPRADAIVMQTRASLSLLRGGAARRACVIANPIAAPVRERRPARVVTAVGRLEAQKGFDLLIRAFALVAPQRPDWRLCIWGEGPLRSALQAQANASGLAGRVDLPGNSAMPGGWLDDAGIFVLSSRYEGMPNVLGEAMAAGVPAIAFDCDFGPREMIVDGVSGRLVPAGDVSALAAAIDATIGDPAAAARLGAAAREAATRFAPAAIVAQWDALLQ